MPVQIRDAKLRAIVNQIVEGGEKISQKDVQALIDAAYSDDGRLSKSEKESIRTILRDYADKFESPEVREKLAQFNRMSNATLRDAAYRFAKDGSISEAEANKLRELAFRDGRISGREKVTLKALLGYYSPSMEPGAKDVVEKMVAGETSDTGSTAPVGPTEPTQPTGPTGSTEVAGEPKVLGENHPRFKAQVLADGTLSVDGNPPQNPVQLGDALYRVANLVDAIPAGKNENLFRSLTLEQKENLFNQLQQAVKMGREGAEGLDQTQQLQLRSSAATLLLHLAESMKSSGAEGDLKARVESAYIDFAKNEDNRILKDSMIYNLKMSADSGKLTRSAAVEAKELFSEIAPTSPPYDDWFKDGNNTINIAWYTGEGPEGFYRGTVEMLKKQGFKPEGPEKEGGPVVYSKTIRNSRGEEITFRIRVKEYNRDIFDEMDNPEFHIVGYDGHSNIGRTIRYALERAPDEAANKKLIFYGLCAGKDNIFRVREKYPDAQIMTTHNSSYFRTSKGPDGKSRMVESENFNALMQVINGIAEKKDWKAIRSDIKNKAIPWYWKNYHALPGGMNYITPIDTNIRRMALDSDFDGQADPIDKLVNFNTFSVREDTRAEFEPVDPGVPADQLDGTKIHTAAASLNTAVLYNPLTKPYNDTGRVIGGGFFEGTPDDPIVKFEKSELNGEPVWILKVNKHYAHMSEEALRAVASFEWNEQIYRENPELYSKRWRNELPWSERSNPTAADRKLMGLTLATFSLAYDMKDAYFGPHRRDREIWDNLLEYYNLPDLNYRDIYKLIYDEEHDYSGSPKMVNNWKKKIPADVLAAME